MDRDSLLQALKDLREKAVKELKKDEKQGRYYTALERLDDIETTLDAGIPSGNIASNDQDLDKKR